MGAPKVKEVVGNECIGCRRKPFEIEQNKTGWECVSCHFAYPSVERARDESWTIELIRGLSARRRKPFRQDRE